VLVALLAALFGRRPRRVVLPERPRILVVRLDERLGNLLLLSPLLDSLRARFPAAVIDLLAQARNRPLLESHPALSTFVPFDKRALLARRGPLATPFALRRRRYDLALDAANPTDPSATQAILTRLSGATHTVGFARGSFGGLFSAPVRPSSDATHEIDMRLELLEALPGTARVRRTRLGPLSQPAVDGAVARYLVELGEARLVILNVGARLADKRLDAATYGELARLCAGRSGTLVCVTYGPDERKLATQLATQVCGEPAARVRLAPPTSLLELAALMRRASAVVTCDTGPMHLAVALGVPTCGIFVSTSSARYGYHDAPHLALDAGGHSAAEWLPAVGAWLALREARACRSDCV